MAKAQATQRFDPRAIFATAEQYLNASVYLLPIQQQYDPQHHVSTPLVICLAFALEAYLKAIITIETNVTPQKTHDLVKLFGKVSAGAQKRIKDICAPSLPEAQKRFDKMSADQGVPTKPIDFNQILSMGKLAFTQIRYAYEGLPPYSGWNAGEILIATRQYLLEINPSWARSSLSYPLPVAHFGP